MRWAAAWEIFRLDLLSKAGFPQPPISPAPPPPQPGSQPSMSPAVAESTHQVRRWSVEKATGQRDTGVTC